jgi:hypothetical protein
MIRKSEKQQMGIFSKRESEDPPGGWFYEKPHPFTLTAMGGAVLDEDGR